MAPDIRVSDDTLKGLDQLKVPYTLIPNLETKSNLTQKNNSNFIYIPSLNLYVAKERTLQGKNWFETHKELQLREERMLTIPQFVEFLKYAKSNFQEIYNNITELRNLWRAEWLDADFKTKGKDLYINSNHVLDENGNILKYDSEILDKDTLMKDKGIDLENWLENPTSQGLPRKDVKKGSLYYWNPRSDNNSVVRFVADSDWSGLNCYWFPSYRDPERGVRAVRHM